MLGIQLLGVPSTNWKPARSFSAQNHGTSGNDTPKPSMAKILAIQRMAFLLSLDTNSRRMAPTSGVNSTIESMWLYMKSALKRGRSNLQVRVTTHQLTVERTFRFASQVLINIQGL